MNDFGAIGRVLAFLIGPSWRSTILSAGGAAFLVWPELEAAFDGDPATHIVWSKVIAAGFLAVWGRSARDNRVCSEQAGAPSKIPVLGTIGTKEPTP